ncbi:hypothetical protein ACTSKR_00705 [Chitinibacteraceae bacterium HSL-7]
MRWVNRALQGLISTLALALIGLGLVHGDWQLAAVIAFVALFLLTLTWMLGEEIRARREPFHRASHRPAGLLLLQLALIAAGISVSVLLTPDWLASLHREDTRCGGFCRASVMLDKALGDAARYAVAALHAAAAAWLGRIGWQLLRRR